jgi:hypothetical protein
MFKLGSFEEEIYASMEKQLIANQVESTKGFSKLARAADLLNTAAEIFEQAGMVTESEEVVNIIQNLASELSK